MQKEEEKIEEVKLDPYAKAIADMNAYDSSLNNALSALAKLNAMPSISQLEKELAGTIKAN